ncbi:MAG TPA: tetratricopeptide repeat protein, partial [Blastocatellia bacterium]|nr:tetratricopeptide repeat protein [Blastocatellia bacterium]
RVTTRLVRVRDGTTMWTGQFDEQMTHLFAVQDGLAAQVAQALSLPLTGEEQQTLTRHHTKNTEAYQLYVKGFYFAERQTAENLRHSLTFFQQALKLDPNYARAYAKMAGVYISLGAMGELPPREAMSLARPAAVKALQLDETLAEGHAIMASLKLHYDWDWAGTEREYQRSLQLSPGAVSAGYGNYLCVMGRFDEALAAVKKAQELNPLSPRINLVISYIYYLSRQYDQAIEQSRLLLTMEPNMGLAYGLLGKALVQKGNYPEAISAFQQAHSLLGGGVEVLDDLAFAYAVAGQAGEARKLLAKFQQLDRKKYGSLYNIARVYVALGEKQQAFQWLERAYEERAVELIYLNVEPQFDSVRSDPRFQHFLRRLNLAS